MLNNNACIGRLRRPDQNGCQRGYSLIKVLVWLVILGAASWQGMKFVHYYYIDWKVQTVFDGIIKNHPEGADDVAAVRASLPRLFELNYIDDGDLPASFYVNLEIKDDGDGLEVSSFYSETVWLLGPVEAMDAHGDYDPHSLTGMDVWRDRARIVLHFTPHAGP